MTNSPPHTRALAWLISGLTIGSLPHFIYQPIWVSLIFIAMIFWRTMAIRYGWPLPQKKMTALSIIHLSIAVFAIVMMLFSYGNLIGRDAGIALLTVMLSLKIVEIRTHRDVYVSCFLGYFLIVTNFFYSQNIPTALLMFIVVIFLTTSLISLNDQKRHIENAHLVKLASQMLLQAIPLMIILFILFPRINGPLWGIPQDAHTSKTGLSDSMTLRNMSDVVLSEEIAFRVKFNNDTIPKQADLYWRGPVLWHTDGSNWTQFTSLDIMATPPKVLNRDHAYTYTTTMEPHNNNWLFALDFPEQTTRYPDHYLHYDGQLKTSKPIAQRQLFTLTSHITYQLNPNSDLLVKAALELPEDLHPRTKKLAKSWLKDSTEPMTLVNKALNYFNQQGFVYTLKPPVLTGDKIDAFLFDTKYGFCQHFAASFTVLMRAAGVPTRIVTGYQGGEINPVNGYLVVRQYDAHAWVEVWLKDQGWLRIDPTFAVSEQRIEQGITSAIPETRTMNQPAFIEQNQHILNIWQTLRNNWNAIDNGWNQWILAYGPELQSAFLEKMGMNNPNWQTMAAWLLIGFGILSTLLSIYLFSQRNHRDPLTQLYDRFCQKAARAGVVRLPQQGPRDFATLLIQRFPHQRADIEGVITTYIDLKYGTHSTNLKQLRQAISQFKFKRRRL